MTNARESLRVSLVVAAVAGALLFAWYARYVLLLLFAGVLVAIFFRRLALLAGNLTGLKPRWTLPLVVLLITGALAGSFAWRGPAIAAEARTLRERLPQAADQLEQRLSRYELGRRVVEQAPSPSELFPDDRDSVARVTGVVSSTVRTIANGVIILFLGIVLAATPRLYTGGMLALVPQRRVARAGEVLDRLGETLWWWLLGRLVSMTYIGVVTGVGLWLLGVPLAFVLGLLAALLSFIPNVGPILSAIPAMLLALASGPRQALWVALLYIGVQMVESYVLGPIIDRKTVYLPPALTVVAQLSLAVFAGILGVALATPLTAAAVVLVTMLYVQDVLGRTDVKVRGH